MLKLKPLLVFVAAMAAGLWLGRCFLLPAPVPAETATDTIYRTNPAVIDSAKHAIARADSALQNAARNAQEAARWHSKALAYGDSLRKLTTPDGALPVEATLDDCRAAFRLSQAEAAASAAEAVSCKARGDSLEGQVKRDTLSLQRLILRIDTLGRQLHVEQTRKRPCRIDLLLAHVDCGKALLVAAGGGALLGFELRR